LSAAVLARKRDDVTVIIRIVQGHGETGPATGAVRESHRGTGEIAFPDPQRGALASHQREDVDLDIDSAEFDRRNKKQSRRNTDPSPADAHEKDPQPQTRLDFAVIKIKTQSTLSPMPRRLRRRQSFRLAKT
jgi:hypothetical protein